MDIDLIFIGALLAFLTFFTATFLLQRYRYRRRKAGDKNYRGFYPSAAVLSLAILSLQNLAQPDLHHLLEQRQLEAEDEENNSDPDDPSAQLTRQLKRIRNGEKIDTLRVPLKIMD